MYLTGALRTACKLRIDKNRTGVTDKKRGKRRLLRATKARNINSNKKDLSPEQRKELLRTLKPRFEKNMNRHNGLEWAIVQGKLEANAERLWSLNEMERTGGEPDVVGHAARFRFSCRRTGDAAGSSPVAPANSLLSLGPPPAGYPLN